MSACPVLYVIFFGAAVGFNSPNGSAKWRTCFDCMISDVLPVVAHDCSYPTKLDIESAPCAIDNLPYLTLPYSSRTCTSQMAGRIVSSPLNPACPTLSHCPQARKRREREREGGVARELLRGNGRVVYQAQSTEARDSERDLMLAGKFVCFARRCSKRCCDRPSQSILPLQGGAMRLTQVGVRC